MTKSKAYSMKSDLTTSTSISDHRPPSIVNMDSITISHDNSVSAVLTYCKHKVLSPYFRLTSFLGWRPLLSHQSPSLSSPSSPSPTNITPSLQSLSSPSSQPQPPPQSIYTSTESAKSFTTLISFIHLIINWSINLINIIYTLLILTLILSSYFLSYCTCYRGDGLPHLLPLIISSNNTINSNINQQGNNNLNIIPNDNLTSFTYNLDNRSTFNQSEPSKLINFLTTSTINNDNHHHGNTIELINNSNTCNNKLISHFIIPDLLHFASYLFLLYLLRTPECERLENLMERGFLQLSQTANWFLESRHLISTLRGFLLLSTLWIICSIILHIIHFNLNLVNFNCLPNSFGVNLSLNSSYNSMAINLHGYDNSSKNLIITDYLLIHNLINVNHIHTIIIYITVTCLTVFDIICSAVVTSYAVHCQLNISFINSLCQGVREKRISFQEFYQRAEESRKFIAYLNNNQAICVSLVAIVFICKICLYSFQLFSRYNNYTNYTLLILSALLWIIILLIPMIQAVRLTGSCYTLRHLGHELKARPFGYQYTDEAELNSLLAYTSSLEMAAKLFNLPIKSSSIVLIFTLILIGVPLLGQIGIISL